MIDLTSRVRRASRSARPAAVLLCRSEQPEERGQFVNRMLLALAGALPLLTVPSFAAAQQPAAAAPTDRKPVADLSSDDDRVRLAAVRALVENGAAKRDAVRAFVEAAKDPASFVRAEAARGLG